MTFLCDIGVRDRILEIPLEHRKLGENVCQIFGETG